MCLPRYLEGDKVQGKGRKQRRALVGDTLCEVHLEHWWERNSSPSMRRRCQGGAWTVSGLSKVRGPLGYF